MTALVLTYHAIEDGPGPLFVSPELFAQHVDTICSSGATFMTVAGLARALGERELPERAIAITFDDGFASVARVAAPLLADRGLPATIYCVAGHLGGTNEWPSQRGNVVAKALAEPEELAELSRKGFEIGSHGFHHAPLVGNDPEQLRREVVDARPALEDALGTAVTTFAYPYGVDPSPRAAALVRATYDAACTTRLALVRAGTDVFDMPRVDAHYLRRLELLGRAIRGDLGRYLRARSLGARARRALRRDYVEIETGGAR